MKWLPRSLNVFYLVLLLRLHLYYVYFYFRRVVIKHESEMPLDYGTTPGGTMFGTTPGGEKMISNTPILVYQYTSTLHAVKSPSAVYTNSRKRVYIISNSKVYLNQFTIVPVFDIKSSSIYQYSTSIKCSTTLIPINYKL
jgi:hypothetical protein